MADEKQDALASVDNIVGGYYLDSDKPNSGAHNSAGLAVKVLSEDEIKRLAETGEPAPLLKKEDAPEAEAKAEQGAASRRGRK
jgi:hypothetical protein